MKETVHFTKMQGAGNAGCTENKRMDSQFLGNI